MNKQFKILYGAVPDSILLSKADWDKYIQKKNPKKHLKNKDKKT